MAGAVHVNGHESFFAFANSTDYASGSSDAGFTIVDGGSLPLALSSDNEYYLNAIAFAPHSVSDEFHMRIVTMDSDKANSIVKSIIFDFHTGASIAGTEMRIINLPNVMEIHAGPSTKFVGLSVDWGDTDALANVGISGYYVAKTGN